MLIKIKWGCLTHQSKVISAFTLKAAYKSDTEQGGCLWLEPHVMKFFWKTLFYVHIFSGYCSFLMIELRTVYVSK